MATVGRIGSDAQQSTFANRSELTAEEFWRLLLTQLQMQDPFKASDTQAMLQQFVALQSAREMARMSDALQRTQALTMLGHSVQAIINGEEKTGKVVGVSLSGGPLSLMVNIQDNIVQIPLSSVIGVMIEEQA